MGESSHLRQTARDAGQHCYGPGDCEARFRLLERSTKELTDTVFGGARSLPTRVTLLEESVPNIEKALEEIKAGINGQSLNRVHIVVAFITAGSAVACGLLTLFAVMYQADRPCRQAPAPAPVYAEPERPPSP